MPGPGAHAVIARPVLRTAAGTGAALCLISAVAYAAVPILGKLGFDEGLSISSLLVGRFAIAAAVLWLLALWFDATPSRRGVVTGLLLGMVVYAAQNGFYFAALERISRDPRDAAGVHRPDLRGDRGRRARAGAAHQGPDRRDPPLAGGHRARADRRGRPRRDRRPRRGPRPGLRGRVRGLHAHLARGRRQRPAADAVGLDHHRRSDPVPRRGGREHRPAPPHDQRRVVDRASAWPWWAP